MPFTQWHDLKPRRDLSADTVFMMMIYELSILWHAIGNAARLGPHKTPGVYTEDQGSCVDPTQKENDL